MKKRTFKSHSKVNKQKCCCSIYLTSTQVSSTEKMNYFAGSKFFIARLARHFSKDIAMDKTKQGIKVVTCMVKLSSLFRKMPEYIFLSKGSYSAFKKI